MIVGYDTHYDAREKKAVGAFVATINSHFTRMESSVLVHDDAQDISTSFEKHTENCLK